MASICRECGESFTPARSDAAYCSSPCRQRAYRDRQRPKPIRNATGVTDAPVTIDAKLALTHQLVREIGKQLETFMVDQKWIQDSSASTSTGQRA